MKKKIFGILFALVLVVSLTLVPAFADNGGAADTAPFGCTDIIVGNEATVDGSTIGTYSCDGALYARIVVEPAQVYPPGTMTPIYYRPFPYSYEEYLYWLDKPVLVGEIPQVEETYGYVSLQVWYDDTRQASMNEYGLTIGETTISGRGELRNENGILSVYTNYKESSLMELGLQRAKTAREAIEVMGSLAEEYGYRGTHGPEHCTVTDGNEAWAFEIFGPGPDWTPGSGEPGALWCAQRIPDGEVGVSANRSRIGEVPVEENDYFMFSPNIRSLALDMGWWDGVEPFVWHDAYAPSDHPNLREWEALNWVAPSLGLDPDDIYQPFSVVPDELVSVQDIMALHRDYYEGTPFDITLDEAWLNKSGRHVGELSAMTCPWGPTDLHDLIGVSAPRSIGTPSSVFSYVSQVRADLPDPIKGCLWFGFGPAATTCYVPVYSGVTELPESWGHTELTRVNRADAWWAFNLVDQLALIKWQYAIEDIEGVRDPAEATFFAQQSDFEKAVVKVFRHPKRGQAAAQELVTDYTNACMNAVSEGYWDLVDYLLFEYYFSGSWGVEQELPTIDCPPVPKGK